MKRNVVIVGGSIAGLYTATLLARNGHDVRLVESENELATPERSLIVTSAYRDILSDLGEAAVVNEVRRFRLHAGSREAQVSLKRPDLIIERATLGRQLAQSAVDAGVEISLGRRLNGLHGEPDGVRLQFDNGDADTVANAVVGADGARSAVAQAAGLPLPRRVPVVQAIVRLPEASCADSVDVWFEPEETPYFYWLVPHGDGTGALGVIAEQPRGLRDRLDRFATARGFEVIEYQGALIPEYDGWSDTHARVGQGDVYLVGDAAGHVKVTTVGGIVNGLWGAEGVCHRIGVNGHAPPRQLGSLRRELGLHLLIRRALHHFDLDDYETLLGVLNASATRTLGEYSRDDTLRLMLHLLVRRPRFALLGARGLLKGVRPGSS